MKCRTFFVLSIVLGIHLPIVLGGDLLSLRFPSCDEITNRLSTLSWAKDFQQIPATVIDNGVLKDVPYNSFKAGDYEVNVYGDPSTPACVEIGIYRTLLNDRNAMKNCAEFISGMLPKASHKDTLGQMRLARDWKKCDGIIMEITPPQDEDAYGGWWVSAYFEKAVNNARASAEEMAKITIPKDAASSPSPSGSSSGWSQSDMKLSRPASKLTEIKLPHVMIGGREYKNVKLVKRNPAEVKVYFSGTAVTMPIEDFNQEHQKQLGYDLIAATAYKAAVMAYKLQIAQAVVGQLLDHSGPVYQQAPPQAYQLPTEQVAQPAAQVAQSIAVFQRPAPQSYQQPSTAYQSQQPQTYNTGTVFVHSYVRSNGVYVRAHTRSR